MISPTLACVDYLHIEQEIREMNRAGVEFFHIDIMDGHFVPNLCLNFDMVEQIASISNTPFDVHLMVKNPMDYIERMTQCGVAYACTHLDTCPEPGAFLDALRRNGIKAGFALAPDEDFERLLPYLGSVDYILLLFVQPGFSGQELLSRIRDRLRRLDELRRQGNYHFLIEADGGVGWDNAHDLAACGADILVAGAFAVFGQPNGLYESCVRFKRLCAAPFIHGMRLSENEEPPTRYKKLLGAFLGAAVGDAMGSATETLTPELIKELFGGPVRGFAVPPPGTPAAGQPAGAVSDDFSLLWHLAVAIARHGGAASEEVAEAAIKSWYQEGKYISTMGQTMEKCVCRLFGLPLRPMGVNINPDLSPKLLVDNHASTNGAAVRVLPVGLMYPGDRASAILKAIAVSRPSHRNSAALAGSCAIAAAASEAMRSGATLHDIVQAGITGARAGHESAVADGKLVAVPSVKRRINLAVELALKSSSLEEAIQRITHTVGVGTAAYESVPAVFGLLVAAKGNVGDCLYAAVNAGNDSDTIACMLGGIVGAWHGVDAFPAEYLSTIQQTNGYDLHSLAHRFDELSKREGVLG